MDKYYCDICNYRTCRKTDFNRHLKTKRHNTNICGKNPKFRRNSLRNSGKNEKSWGT